MADAKRIRSKNFSEYEKTLLKQILTNHPVIESKIHTTASEQKKRSAWNAICNEFNANENATTRTIQQLQVRFLHYYHCSFLIFIFLGQFIMNDFCLYRLCGTTLNWL